MKKNRKNYIAIAVAIFVLIIIAVPFWSFDNIEDKLNNEASMLDSYKALENAEMEWNGRNGYFIVPENIDADKLKAAINDIEEIQGVRNVKTIKYKPEQTPGDFVLNWYPDEKNISGKLNKESIKKVENIFGIKGLTIDNQYYMTDDMLNNLEVLGKSIFDDLSVGKLETDSKTVKISGTTIDCDTYDTLNVEWSKYEWLEFDIEKPELPEPDPTPGDIILDWNQGKKDISGKMDEESIENLEDIFGVIGLTIDNKYYITDDMLNKLEIFGKIIFDDLTFGKLETNGEKVKISGTTVDIDTHDRLNNEWSKYDWLEIDIHKPEDEVQIAIDQLMSLDNIQFDFSEIRVKESSVALLDEIAEIMVEHEEITLDIIGHTDAIGQIVNNQILSERRAEEVKNQLIKEVSMLYA